MIKPQRTLTRRCLLGTGAVAALALAGCATREKTTLREDPRLSEFPPEPSLGTDAEMYASRVDDGFVLPAIPYERLDPRFRRQIVPDPTGEPADTVVVDTANHFLYFVRPDRQAVRYGVGLGKEGFAWSGRAIVEWKQHWPRWFPPEEMIARRPELAKYKAIQVPGKNEWEGGQPGGLENPLGARAMYLFQDGKDTLFRLHGSPEWDSIGKSVSSGCVRLINQDVIDLYDRVPEKAPVLVTSGLVTV